VPLVPAKTQLPGVRTLSSLTHAVEAAPSKPWAKITVSPPPVLGSSSVAQDQAKPLLVAVVVLNEVLPR
jgi:hypothetical protein